MLDGDARKEELALKAAKRRAYNAANRHRFFPAQKAKAHAKYLANRETRLAKQAAWRAANPGRYKEWLATVPVTWDKRNYPRKRAQGSKYRARRGLAATKDPVQLQKIVELYSVAQSICLHVDHAVPLFGRNVCGLHNLHNLQLMTEEANKAKSNRFPVHGVQIPPF